MINLVLVKLTKSLDLIYNFTGPSTSAACFAQQRQQSQMGEEGIVHLADSDSEVELLSEYNKVWNKFVPNSTIQIGFPPSSLLPCNILSRDSIYEFDMKSKENATMHSDSELEYYVDELSLDSSSGNNNKERQSSSMFGCRSWSEWKIKNAQNAKKTLSESLLGEAQSSGAETFNKLYQGNDSEGESLSKRKMAGGWKDFNIPYDIYLPMSSFTKHRARKDIQPSFVVAIVG
jgi:hypothetical protein